MSSTTIPSWLKASFSSSHLTTVIRTLAARELTRESARATSRRRSTPSQASTNVPPNLATVTPKTHMASDIEHYSISFGCKPWNQLYNRYLYLEPYDRTRVIVGDWDGEQAEVRNVTGDDGDGAGGRYINGNWVRELFGGKWWIATQAPLPNTMHTFLSLLLQPTSPPSCLEPSSPTNRTGKGKVRTIVQLTQNFEQGRQKAHVYFPSAVGQSFVVLPEQGSSAPVLKVTLLASHNITEAKCIRSTVSVLPISGSTPTTEGDDEGPIIFRHLLYEAWPDHGVPQREDRAGFLEFIRLVDRTNKDVSEFRPSANNPDIDPDPPIMVNCSAGVGRTGTFIALASLLRAYDRLSATSPGAPSPTQVPAKPGLPPSPLGPLPDAIKGDLVAQEIDSLREQRPSMVQRDEQILLIYDVLAIAIAQ